jgi:hypothetical protein
MDSVVTGLIGGSVISVMLLVGGGVAIWQGLPEKIMANHGLIFFWLMALTGLCIGNLFFNRSVSIALWAAPSQTENAVPS